MEKPSTPPQPPPLLMVSQTFNLFFFHRGLISIKPVVEVVFWFHASQFFSLIAPLFPHLYPLTVVFGLFSFPFQSRARLFSSFQPFRPLVSGPPFPRWVGGIDILSFGVVLRIHPPLSPTPVKTASRPPLPAIFSLVSKIDCVCVRFLRIFHASPPLSSVFPIQGASPQLLHRFFPPPHEPLRLHPFFHNPLFSSPTRPLLLFSFWVPPLSIPSITFKRSTLCLPFPQSLTVHPFFPPVLGDCRVQSPSPIVSPPHAHFFPPPQPFRIFRFTLRFFLFLHPHFSQVLLAPTSPVPPNLLANPLPHNFF